MGTYLLLNYQTQNMDKLLSKMLHPTCGTNCHLTLGTVTLCWILRNTSRLIFLELVIHSLLICLTFYPILLYPFINNSIFCLCTALRALFLRIGAI